MTMRTTVGALFSSRKQVEIEILLTRNSSNKRAHIKERKVITLESDESDGQETSSEREKFLYKEANRCAEKLNALQERIGELAEEITRTQCEIWQFEGLTSRVSDELGEIYSERMESQKEEPEGNHDS